nr:hypothetical protein [Tanacetum cinerariifolium]
MFDCDNYLSSENDCESWPPTSLYDRFQPSDGYHVVPPPYTGTFMPPKPNLVFNTAPTAVETDHPAFTVQLSPTKPAQDLSHTNRPIAPIIEDWVSDSEDESKTKAPQIVSSFVHSSEQVKSPRNSVKHVETTIPTTTPKPASLKSDSSGKKRNRKACFVCKSVDHLIKDCDYHAKKMAQPTPRTHAHRGNYKQYAPLTHTNPQKHMVPAVVLTRSKPVSISAVRPVSADVPKIKVTRPSHAHPIVTKSKSPIRRHITRSPSPKTSNSPPRVTAVKAPVVSAAQASQTNDKHGLGYFSSESGCESLSPSSPSDRLQPSGGYHVVPPPITRTFMPSKPDLVFHTASIDVETDHSAFIVQLSPFKPTHDLSHTTRPLAPIIKEWVSNSKDESQTNDPQSVPSFVQSSEQVKTSRHFVQPITAPILDATPKPASQKSNSSSKRKNRKTCFVCRSVDHLIKDYDYHAKKKAQSTPRNYAHK